MSQHFLLSAKARTLSLASVARMTDEEARETFQRIRWADNAGEPFCPRCACAALYTYKTRNLWKCKSCEHQFSVTSGTIFASRKMPVRDILLSIAIFTNGAKGHSALQLSRDLNCQYKSAYVLAHKIREALGAGDKGATVSGEIEVDGCYVGGYVKPANFKENRRDRRMASKSDRQATRRNRYAGTRWQDFDLCLQDRGFQRCDCCQPHRAGQCCSRGRSLALGCPTQSI